jgi:DNA-binding SARP family transcriptional activator
LQPLLALLFTCHCAILTNFRNLLHKLRHGLPEPDRFPLVDTQTVQWRPDAHCTIDVADFEAALTQATTCAELEMAAKLDHGSLLPSRDDHMLYYLLTHYRNDTKPILAGP